MKITVSAKTKRGKVALQKHIDTKLNRQQKLMKKAFFKEIIVKEPVFKIIIEFKAPALALIPKIYDFTMQIEETLIENGATREDFEIIVDEE